MRIYHVVSNKVWGGGEQYVFDLCQHLIKDGHQVELFCRPCQPVLKQLLTLNIPIHTLSLKGIGDIVSSMHMAKVIGREACIVHVHNFKDAFTVLYACKIAGNRQVKLIVTRHLVRQGKTSWLYRWLYRSIHRVIFVSNLAKMEFMSSYPKIPEEKLSVVHNSIVPQPTVQTENLREMLSVPSQAVLAMYHGRLAAEKGLDVLIKAIRKTSAETIHLVLIGSGDEVYVRNLRQLIEQMNLRDRVHLLGFRDNVISYIQQADFGVIPSIARESFSLACLEYMSQGRCVITTNNGGQSEYVKNDINGILVPPSDTEALTVALNRITGNKELCETLGKRAQHDFSSMLSYEQFYKRILSVYED